jgi:lipopolysaccharide export system protein LptA
MKTLNRLVAVFVLGLGGTFGAFAQTPDPSRRNVEITADNFSLVEAEHQAVFSGNAVVLHPSVTVHAPEIVVVYGAGTTDIQSFEARGGGVRLETADQSATGDRAVFDPANQVLTLSGNVTVNNSAGTLTGATLVINLANNTSTFSSGSGGRVTGVFTAP